MQCWLPEKVNGATGFTIRIFTLTKTSSLGVMRGLQNSRGSQMRDSGHSLCPSTQSLDFPFKPPQDECEVRNGSVLFPAPVWLVSLEHPCVWRQSVYNPGSSTMVPGKFNTVNRLFSLTLTLVFMKGNTLHSSPSYIIILSHYPP